MLVLTAAAGALEGASAVIFHAPAFAVSAGATSLFAIAVLIAGHRVRSGHPGQARIALAVGLTVLALLGAVLIPGVGSAMALLPTVSVVLVLPHVRRDRLMPVMALAAGSAVAILALGELPHPLPAIAGAEGIIFEDGILLGVAILLLAGVADYAMDARDSIHDLRNASERQFQATSACWRSWARSGRSRRRPAPRRRLGIARALGDLPVADVAVIFEVVDGGLDVLAVAGDPSFPFRVRHRLPEARAAYMLDRSARGAWSESWADRASGRR